MLAHTVLTAIQLPSASAYEVPSLARIVLRVYPSATRSLCRSTHALGRFPVAFPLG